VRYRREPAGALSGDSPVDSRWWYWVAAVPLAFAFWLLSAAWVAVGTALDPALADGTGFGGALGVALVAFGVPLLVLLVAFPASVLFDARAARDQSDWQPSAGRYAGLATVGTVVALALVAAVALDLVDETTGSVAAVTLGYLLATPVALRYLRRRRDEVGLF
jgi:hypothetical protein